VHRAHGLFADHPATASCDASDRCVVHGRVTTVGSRRSRPGAQPPAPDGNQDLAGLLSRSDCPQVLGGLLVPGDVRVSSTLREKVLSVVGVGRTVRGHRHIRSPTRPRDRNSNGAGRSRCRWTQSGADRSCGPGGSWRSRRPRWCGGSMRPSCFVPNRRQKAENEIRISTRRYA
jgi:hypothetical protein